MIQRIIFSVLFTFLFSLQVFAGGDVSISNEDISFSSSPAISGKITKIYAVIHNNSSEDLTGTAQFLDEQMNKNIGTDVSFSIVAGATHTIFTTMIFEGYGNHTIAVTLLPFDKTGDDNSNNVAYKKIFVDGDLDGDGIGDSVDGDLDGDGVSNNEDPFPRNAKEWKDTDLDGIGNNADEDDDNDGIIDIKDAFPTDPNESKDTDLDGIGDNSDDDTDGDGILNDEEILTDPFNPDSDNDGITDKEDQYPLDSKRNLDTDNDGISNFDDFDDDNDGVMDTKDKFPLDPDEWVDSDGDGIGNNADNDDDNDSWSDEYEKTESNTNPLHADSDKDGVLDPEDLYPLNPEEWKDSDKDGIGDNADNDDDNDGVLDEDDVFPFDGNEWKDTDGDELGDNVDNDDDNDGVLDEDDVFPFDENEWEDSDQDGLGNNADPNDNNKGPTIKIDGPQEIMQGDKVIFSAHESFDEDGVILSLQWKDDQGRTGKGEIFKTVFHKPGTHSVTLRIIDDLNEYREKTLTFEVAPNWAPYIAILGFIALLGIFWVLQRRKKL